jgi:hypothetical protein
MDIPMSRLSLRTQQHIGDLRNAVDGRRSMFNVSVFDHHDGGEHWVVATNIGVGPPIAVTADTAFPRIAERLDLPEHRCRFFGHSIPPEPHLVSASLDRIRLSWPDGRPFPNGVLSEAYAPTFEEAALLQEAGLWLTDWIGWEIAWEDGTPGPAIEAYSGRYYRDKSGLLHPGDRVLRLRPPGHGE